MSDQIASSFTISTGGLFYRLMRRMHLTEANRYCTWRRIAVFSGIAWLPLLILTALNKTLTASGLELPFLRDPVPYVRYLIALPLLIGVERFVDPLLSAIVGHFDTSGIIEDDARPQLNHALDQLMRRRDAAWVDVFLLLLAVSLVWVIMSSSGLSAIGIEPSSWILTGTGAVQTLTPAGWWYLVVSLPLVQFLIGRWIWRLIIWISFMNRISRLRLVLQPTHPDNFAGLGILSGGQSSFVVIFAAIGAIMSSTLARDIMHQGRLLSDVVWEAIGFVLVCAVIVIAPLCTFSNQLFKAKRQGLIDYSGLGYQLSKAFHVKWIESKTIAQEAQIITAVDPSAMADYGAIYATVSGMRMIPLTPQTAISVLVALVIPFIPLIFTQISLVEALQRIAKSLV